MQATVIGPLCFIHILLMCDVTHVLGALRHDRNTIRQCAQQLTNETRKLGTI